MRSIKFEHVLARTNAVVMSWFQLGFVGLVEEDWLATLSTVDPDDVTFVDFIEEGRTLARQLRDDVRRLDIILL